MDVPQHAGEEIADHPDKHDRGGDECEAFHGDPLLLVHVDPSSIRCRANQHWAGDGSIAIPSIGVCVANGVARAAWFCLVGGKGASSDSGRLAWIERWKPWSTR